jgi:hypothetical protein
MTAILHSALPLTALLHSKIRNRPYGSFLFSITTTLWTNTSKGTTSSMLESYLVQISHADSFILPLVKELLELVIGVSAYNVLLCSFFSLHTYTITAFGDIPTISMLMHIKGHNSLCPCQMCTIKDI